MTHRSSLAIALVATALSCASTAPRRVAPRSNREAPTTHEGRAIYPRAITDARLSALWSEARAQLSDAAPAMADATSERVREALTPWLRGRLDGATRIANLARSLPPTSAPEDALLAALSYALVLDDARAQLLAVRPPSTLRGNANAERVWREALIESAATLTLSTRDAWQRCATAAETSPEVVRAWAATCSERADALASAIPPDAPSRAGTAEGRVTVPPECEGGEYASRAPDPEAPPPDESRNREIAVVYEGDLFDGPEREVLVDAVHAWFARLPGARLVSRGEVRAAEALRAARRWRANGPVCGQPPPLAALLADAHPNLVIAAIETWCGQFVDGSHAGATPESRAICTLAIHARRAGTANRSGLPDDVSADLDAPRGSVARWTDAVARLSASSAMRAVFGGLGMTSRHAEYRVLGYAEDDPWLRIGTTLYGTAERSEARDLLMGCATRGGGVGSYRIAWTVSPIGEGSDVRVEPITAPVDGSASQVAACVTERLARMRWPCTRSGAPSRIEARLCLGWR